LIKFNASRKLEGGLINGIIVIIIAIKKNK